MILDVRASVVRRAGQRRDQRLLNQLAAPMAVGALIITVEDYFFKTPKLRGART